MLDWKIQLVKPVETLNTFAFAAWERMLPDLEKWMRQKLIPSLVFGGHGIQGIAQTDFYQWISSPQGLSELGIEKDQPPRLLKAYETSAFSIKKYKKTIILNFGEVAKLKMATPHPASGTGQLRVSSWLEWIVDGKTVTDRGFVARNKLKKGSQGAVRLGAPLGGLMLKKGAYGNAGLWQFPSRLMNYEKHWFDKNVGAIQTAITEQALSLFIDELSK